MCIHSVICLTSEENLRTVRHLVVWKIQAIRIYYCLKPECKGRCFFIQILNSFYQQVGEGCFFAVPAPSHLQSALCLRVPNHYP